MHGSGAPAFLRDKSAFAKYRQHRGILGQDFGDQSRKPTLTGNHDEMPKQGCSNSLPLIFVDDREGHFGRTGLRDDIAAAADDGVFAALLDRSDEGHMRDKVDVDEEIDFFFAKSALGTEKRR